ncbi:MAG: hypothetical protein GXO00_01615 [Candidatus Diapherotrites archaeon]|nr:hypothetical protein [Candidatus Diapherotrites archaeon]
MDPIALLLPALVISAISYFLEGKVSWWFVPLLVFFVSLFLQINALYVYFSDVGVSLDLSKLVARFLYPMVLSSLYLGILALLFTLVALGVYRYTERHVANRFLRHVISVYISLLLFQLWVEVFPWTVELLLRFYFG